MKFKIGLLLLILMSHINGVSAAIVTLNGSTIKYEYDDVANAAALAIFGTPTIVGDAIRFLPPDFRAESIDGAGTDLITANFVFSRVYSTNQFAITQLQIVEFGDYEITNGDNVTADLLFTVSNNDDIFDFYSDSQSLDVNGGSTGLQTWQLNSFVNPTSGGNDYSISIQNTLTATTDAFGETAWIQKKLTFTATTAAVVPVPATVWFFGTALAGLMGIRAKR